MTLIYLLLVIIIILLLVIIYSNRDKGAHFNKLFSPIKGVKAFKKDDNRNKTHPDEIVKYNDFQYIPRREAERLDKLGLTVEKEK